jgi:hypothetical protein
MQDGDAGGGGQQGEEIGGCRAGAEEAETHFIGGGFTRVRDHHSRAHRQAAGGRMVEGAGKYPGHLGEGAWEYLGPPSSPHLPVRGDRIMFQGKWKENIEWDAEEGICREARHRKFLMTMIRTPASISLLTESPFPAP